MCERIRCYGDVIKSKLEGVDESPFIAETKYYLFHRDSIWSKTTESNLYIYHRKQTSDFSYIIIPGVIGAGRNYPMRYPISQESVDIYISKDIKD